jgi:MFS transporter, DHA1 family, multidrug resistance protein
VQPWVRNLVALWLVQFLTMAGFSSVMPFLPIYVKELGVSSVEEIGIWSGLLFSAAFITTALMSPVWGTVGDRHGRKPMLVRALVAMAFCLAAMAFASSVWQLLVLRIVQGFLGGSTPMANALMATSAPRQRLGFAMGLLQTAAASGTIIGPLIGGSLADLVGVRPVFFVTAGLLLGAGLLAVSTVREDFTPTPRLAGEGFFGGVREIMGFSQLRFVFLLLFVAQFSAMIIEPIVTLYISTLPSVSAENLGSQSGLIFAVAGFTGLVAAPLWGRLGDRTARYKAIISVALLGASLSYFPQALVDSPGQFLVFRGLLGAFNAALGPAVFAVIASVVPANRQGSAFGLTATPIMMGNVVGPVAGGLLQAAFGIHSIFFLTGGLLFAVALCSNWLVREPGRTVAA